MSKAKAELVNGDKWINCVHPPPAAPGAPAASAGSPEAAPSSVLLVPPAPAPGPLRTFLEYLQYPYFQFPNTSCNVCNGYYGPSFGEPVCLTCHAFLFPDHAASQPTYYNSEKTDDDDSGNDEPSDMNYANERRLNYPRNNLLFDRRQEFPDNGNQAEDENEEDEDNSPEPANLGLFNNMIPPHCPPKVEHRLELLSNANVHPGDRPRGPDCTVQLPPEVLLWIFSYLDDLSLCSVSLVCRQWNRLLKADVPDQNWENFTKKRWPLYKPLVDNNSWFKTCQRLMSSCFCYTCLVQMAVQAQPIEEESTWRRNRLRTEVKLLHNDPPEGISAVPLDAKCCHWQATLTGPMGSPYEGGLFFLYIQIPVSYPLFPPVVRFLTKILHPNVSRHGDVGIDCIHHNWSLALTISKILISIQSFLTDPYTKVCMEPAIGHLYNTDRKKFECLARQWTWKYAMIDTLLN